MTTLSDQAFIHRSYVNEHPGLSDNERLEFLGDAVLSVIISHRLYQLLPDMPEGELTSRRSYLVQTGSLANKAIQLGLDKKLLMSRGEEESGGRTNTGLLANTFEAVLGAKYLNEGLAACESYLAEIFPDQELLAAVNTKDPKSRLQEQLQAQGLGTPVYKTVTAEGPDHAKTFTISVSANNIVLGAGTGPSKQKAESAAAQAALQAKSMLK